MIFLSKASLGFELNGAQNQGKLNLGIEGKILHQVLSLKKTAKYFNAKCFQSYSDAYYREIFNEAHPLKANSVIGRKQELREKSYLSIKGFVSSLAAEAIQRKRLHGTKDMNEVSNLIRSYLNQINGVKKDDITKKLHRSLSWFLDLLSGEIKGELLARYRKPCSTLTKAFSQEEKASYGYLYFANTPHGQIVKSIFEMMDTGENNFQCLSTKLQRYLVKFFREIYEEIILLANDEQEMLAIYNMEHRLNSRWNQKAEKILAVFVMEMVENLSRKYNIPPFYLYLESLIRIKSVMITHSDKLQGRDNELIRISNAIQNTLKKSEAFYLPGTTNSTDVILQIAGKEVLALPEATGGIVLATTTNKTSVEYQQRERLTKTWLNFLVQTYQDKFPQDAVRFPNFQAYLASQLRYMLEKLIIKNVHVADKNANPMLHLWKEIASKNPPKNTSSTPYVKDPWSFYVNNPMNELFKDLKFKEAEEMVSSIQVYLKDFKNLIAARSIYIADYSKRNPNERLNTNFYGENKSKGHWINFEFESAIEGVFIAMIEKLKSKNMLTERRVDDIRPLVEDNFNGRMQKKILKILNE